MTDPAVVMAAIRLGAPLELRPLDGGDDWAVLVAGARLGGVRWSYSPKWNGCGWVAHGDPEGRTFWYAENAARQALGLWLRERGAGANDSERERLTMVVPCPDADHLRAGG